VGINKISLKRLGIPTGNNGYIWISPSAVEHDPSLTTAEETSGVKAVSFNLIYCLLRHSVVFPIATSGSRGQGDNGKAKELHHGFSRAESTTV